MSDVTAPEAHAAPAPTTAPVAGAPPVAPVADKGTQPDAPVADGPAPDASDWRRTLAGEDDKSYKDLQKYNTPADFNKAFKDTQTALRNRDDGVIKLLGEDATDEQKAEFNKKLGIPTAAKDYKITAAVPDGLEVSDADKAFLGSITEQLHKKGGFLATPEGVNQAHELYYGLLAEQTAQMAAGAEMARVQAEKDLKIEWGSEYEINKKYAEAGIQSFFDVDDPDDILQITLANGSVLGTDKRFIKAMAAASRASGEDPVFLQTLVSGDGLAGDNLDAEIKKLEGYRDTDKAKYAEVSAPGARLQQLMERKARSAR